MSIIVPEKDMDEITGIKIGRSGRSKYQMQCEFLRRTGIPFIENAKGRPIVAIAAIEGRKQKEETIKPSWQPRLASA
jgi:hypothetical protein